MKTLRLTIVLLVLATLLAACGGETVVEVTRMVTEVVTEKETIIETVVVEGTPQVKEVEVTKEVIKEVVKEVEVTPVPEGPDYDESAPIVVWVDDVRQMGIDLFKEHNPDVADLIQEEIQNRGELPTKVLLWNNINEGWPDVVFAEPDIVQAIADPAHDYPMDVTPWVSQDVIDGFAEGALAPCYREGELLCLRSDVAPNVLWYNATLMDEFGYEVPTTWEEYLEVGLQVAEEHPGYVVGACGDSQCHNAYFWPSQCPAHQDLGDNTLYINYLDDKCVRAANLLDQLIAAGSIMPAKGPFSAEFIEKAQANQLLMFVGASWYGEHVFGGKEDSLYYQTSENQLGVAPPLKWADEDVNWTGAQGGSSWAMSRHTKNPKLAARLIEWLTTAPEYMGEQGTTQPAYMANATMWGESLGDKPLYAFDPYPVMEESAALMDPLWNEPVRYTVAVGGIWEDVINEGLLAGQTIEELLPALQERMVQEAEANAYLVKTSE